MYRLTTNAVRGPPDISAFAELLRPVDIEGYARYLYAYVDERGICAVCDFFDQLMREGKKSVRNLYRVSMRRYGMQGQAPWEKWHMFDETKPPAGILKDARGNKLSLDGLGEFKHIDDQSRIVHDLEPGGLVVLLTVRTGKNEDALDAQTVNPALKAREEYRRRKAACLSKRRA